MTYTTNARQNLLTTYRPGAAGLLVLPLRLVVGWTYFSAFWRRAVLENKLDPDVPGYVGEKFNHFLPQAFGIKPVIGFLVDHPDLLKWSMIGFTAVEGVVGFCLIVGLFTRAMSVGVFVLAFGILMGSGWLGTTCLDEWQIGILGLAAGFTIFLAGGGTCSLDHLAATRNLSLTRRRWYTWTASGALNVPGRFAVSGAIAVLLIALITNQHFHGGVYGPLHNKSIAPVIDVSEARISGDCLEFTVYRTQGVDVYGSFLVDIAVTDNLTDRVVFELSGRQLAAVGDAGIVNFHIAAVRTGPYGFVVPLGAKAHVSLEMNQHIVDSHHHYSLLLTDVSGTTWAAAVKLEQPA